MNDKDSDLIFEAYKDSVSLNQENFLKTLGLGKFGTLGRGRDRAGSAASSAQQSSAKQQESDPRDMIPVNLGGRPDRIDKNDLIYKSETIDTIGDDPDNNVEFKIYKAQPPYGGSSHPLDNMPVFIPLVVIKSDDYPRPPAIIGKMGAARDTKEQAMQDLQQFMAAYRKDKN